MNNCKATPGKCKTCGYVRSSESDRVCGMEIYDPVEQWKCNDETVITDKILVALIAIAGLFGLAKAFGVW